MKKLLAFLLALTLTLSLGVTAFAVEGHYGSIATATQTITVKTTPLTWTMEIPADLTIPFPNPIATTETPMSGRFKITDVSWDEINGQIFGYILYDGMLWEQTDQPTPDTIKYTIVAKFYLEDGSLWSNNGKSDFEVLNRFDLPTEDPYNMPQLPLYCGKQNPGSREAELYVRIDENQWRKAAPGATYQETVTYSSLAQLNN